MNEEKEVKPAAPEVAGQTAEQLPEHGVSSVASSRRKPVSGTLLLTAAGVIALLVGGLTFAYLKFAPSADDPAKAGQQYTDQHYTSSRTLTVNPVPPKKEEPKPVEPAKPVAQTQPQLTIVERGPRTSPRDTRKPEPTLEERRFAAPLMTDAQGTSETPPMPQVPEANTRPPRDGGKLAAMLNSVDTPAVRATHMGDRSLVLPKGTFIDCILETRVNTTVPGMTSCVISQDIYSANGKVLLVERGSKAIGEYKGSVANGLDRIFVLWTELQTPNGVRVQLDSPGADALGGSGLEGYTDYHWWARFGNALLFSLIQDGFDYVIAKEQENNGGMSYYENSSDGIEEIIREAMRQSGDIPPTLTKNQGERIGIFVARDVDFSSVYRLAPKR